MFRHISNFLPKEPLRVDDENLCAQCGSNLPCPICAPAAPPAPRGRPSALEVWLRDPIGVAVVFVGEGVKATEFDALMRSRGFFVEEAVAFVGELMERRIVSGGVVVAHRPGFREAVERWESPRLLVVKDLGKELDAAASVAAVVGEIVCKRADYERPTLIALPAAGKAERDEVLRKVERRHGLNLSQAKRLDCKRRDVE